LLGNVGGSEDWWLNVDGGSGWTASDGEDDEDDDDDDDDAAAETG